MEGNEGGGENEMVGKKSALLLAFFVCFLSSCFYFFFDNTTTTMMASAADTTPRVASVVIGNPQKFAEKKKKFALGGKDALQVFLLSFLSAWPFRSSLSLSLSCAIFADILFSFFFE